MLQQLFVGFKTELKQESRLNCALDTSAQWERNLARRSLVDAEVARSGCRNQDGSVAFSCNHLQGLNHGIGGAWLIASFTLDLFGALSHLQNQLVTVGVAVKELVQNASCAHLNK